MNSFDSLEAPSLKVSQKVYIPFKRMIGLIGAVLGIIVCFVLLWWWVVPVNLIVTKGHPFFVSIRIGKNGRPFKLVKFRTMRLDADPTLASTNPRAQGQVTRFGAFLRLASIDETAQLWNVLVGQMAFIGPRPLLNTNPQDLITISMREKNGSFMLKPGLSGYAQIHKRGALDPIQKANYDYVYLKKFSLWFDFKIFVITVLTLFGVTRGK